MRSPFLRFVLVAFETLSFAGMQRKMIKRSRNIAAIAAINQPAIPKNNTVISGAPAAVASDRMAPANKPDAMVAPPIPNRTFFFHSEFHPPYVESIM